MQFRRGSIAMCFRASIQLLLGTLLVAPSLAGPPLPVDDAPPPRDSICVGDLDYDGDVDLSDLTMMLADYGMTGVTYDQGDLDGDGDVDLSDLAILLSNFGKTCDHVDVDLDADNDQNGEVEGSDAEESVEETRPALVLANCDDDDGDGVQDYNNDVVDGANDVLDLAELIIRKLPALPVGAKVYLEVANHADDATTTPAAEERVRVFDKRDVDGEEVLGPTAGDSFLIPANDASGRKIDVATLQTKDLTFGVEGISFGREVMFSLVVRNAKGVEIGRDNVAFQVAPFLFLPNNAQVTKTFVSQADHGADPNGNAINNDAFTAAFDAKDGVATTIIPSVLSKDDVWAQDEWEIGYSAVPVKPAAPGQPDFRWMPIFMDLPRDRGLDQFPADFLLGPDVGVFDSPGTSPSSLNYGGNLECAGPVSVGGKDYLTGRIILGDSVRKPMDPDLKSFLVSQVVQSPIVLDTSWLGVGHVDEIFGVVPDASTADKRDFKMLIGDPATAISILDNMNRSDMGGYVIMNGQGGYAMKVSDFMSNVEGIKQFNENLQATIDGIRTQLEAELNITLVKIPALYELPLTQQAVADRANTSKATLTLSLDDDVTSGSAPFDATLWRIEFWDPADPTDYSVESADYWEGTFAYDGTGSTRGDYASPTGALRIPASRWNGAPAAGDLFYVLVVKAGAPGVAGAWFPGMQNAQVANSVALVPDPFGPKAVTFTTAGVASGKDDGDNPSVIEITINGTEVKVYPQMGDTAAQVLGRMDLALTLAGFTTANNAAGGLDVLTAPDKDGPNGATVFNFDNGVQVATTVHKDPFKDAYEQAVNGLGLTVEYLDDFAWYHRAQGEVHCGSNRIAQPFSEAGARWWLQN